MSFLHIITDESYANACFTRLKQLYQIA